LGPAQKSSLSLHKQETLEQSHPAKGPREMAPEPKHLRDEER
jgi:hypothetical protein